jgi:hypothetical protein
MLSKMGAKLNSGLKAKSNARIVHSRHTTRRTKSSIALRMFYASLIITFMPALSSVTAAEDALEAKCGACHTMSSEIDRSEFDDLLTSYNWANWSSVPLRVWISNHHKPRIPSVNISQSEAAKINGYIADLKSQSKFGDTETSGSDAFFADAAVAEPSVSVGDRSNAADGTKMADGVELEEPIKNDSEEITVDFSECLNCQ